MIHWQKIVIEQHTYFHNITTEKLALKILLIIFHYLLKPKLLRIIMKIVVMVRKLN